MSPSQSGSDGCLKQAFPKIWILCSKNTFSISHNKFWGLSSFRQQLSGFLENWQETLWVLSVLLSCLQPALTSGPLLSLWSLAVTALATMARSISPGCALPQGSHVSLFTGAQEQPQSAHVACFRTLPLSCAGNWPPWFPEHVWGFCSSPTQCNTQVLCSQWSPLDLSPFSFFLGEIWGVRSSLQSPSSQSLEPHYHRLKRFSQEAISVFRDKKGEQGGIDGALVYLLVFAVKGPLQMFSSTLFKDLVQ